MFPLSAAAPNKLTREISKPNLECPLLALSNKVKLYCEGQSLLRGREIVGIVGTLVVPSNLLAPTFSRCFSEWLPRLKIKTSSLEEVLGKEESPGILKKIISFPQSRSFSPDTPKLTPNLNAVNILLRRECTSLLILLTSLALAGNAREPGNLDRLLGASSLKGILIFKK